MSEEQDIPRALTDRVFKSLSELEAYTPPETPQDWACVEAMQTIRALCALLEIDAQNMSGPSHE